MDAFKGRRVFSKMGRLVLALIIILLIAGYFMLGDYLFRKDFSVSYEFRLGDQYESPGEAKSMPAYIDIVSFDGETGKVVSGLSLAKRYTELILDVQGLTPETLEIEAEYLGAPQQLWMHIGGRFSEPYHSVPLFLSEIEEGGWDVMHEDGLSLYQRTKRFSSIGDFLARAEDLEEDAALAGIRPDEVLARGSGPDATGTVETLGMPLRGAHTFELLVSTGRLHVEVRKKDLNRYTGGDDVLIRLRRKGRTYHEAIIPDDGNLSDDAMEADENQIVSIDMEDCESGSYTLDISPLTWGDDFVLTSLRTDAAKCLARNTLFLFDPLETGPEPTVPATTSATLFLDGPAGVLSAETWHPIVPRSIRVDGIPLLSFENKGPGAPAQKGAVILGEGRKRLDITNPGSLRVEFLGSGFSFDPDLAFDPGFMRLKPWNENAAQPFSVVFARDYESPARDGETFTSKRIIPMKGVPLPGEKVKIVLEKIGEEDILLTSLKIKLE